MPPSTLPGGCRLSPSFGSVDWLSQSSCSMLTVTSRPAEVSWARLPGPGQVSGTQEGHSSDQSLPEPVAGKSPEASQIVLGGLRHRKACTPCLPSAPGRGWGIPRGAGMLPASPESECCPWKPTSMPEISLPLGPTFTSPPHLSQPVPGPTSAHSSPVHGALRRWGWSTGPHTC